MSPRCRAIKKALLRFLVSLAVLLLVLLLAGAVVRTYIPQDEAGLQQSQTIKLSRHRCGYRSDFSQLDVDSICDPPRQRVCRAARVDHLEDVNGIVEARLRIGTGSSLKIFVFPPVDLISGHLIRRGRWEGRSVEFLTWALRAAPNSVLIDGGSGLGVFALHAARVGRRVLAIDANYQNAIRLVKSAHSNGYSHLVHVYWNALSSLSDRAELHMRLPADCNVGGGAPAPPTSTATTDTYVADHIRVRAAGLDELTSAASKHLAGASVAFLKLDIEGHEWIALSTGYRMFRQFNVPMVMMEWTATRDGRHDKAAFVVKFFTDRGFSPYALTGGWPVAKPHLLNPSQWLSWPGDIIWARNITQLIHSWR